MSAAFTPGPWRLGMMGGENLTHVVDMGNPPAAPFVALYEGAPVSASGFTGFPHTAVAHSDGDRCEIEANARLIAAAPDMFAMLKELRGVLESLIGHAETNIDLSAIDALLAKAVRQ